MRKSEIYVSAENRRACSIVARSEGPNVTTDEVADRLLWWALAQRYPALLSHQKQIEQIEEQMIAELQGNRQ